MAAWILLAVALLIFAELFRTNALLRGIYLMLEKQNRPPSSDSHRWVNQLEQDAKQAIPDSRSALIYLLIGFGALAVMLWVLWQFLLPGSP